MTEGTVDSAAWALRILRLLEDGEPRGLTEIAATFGLSNSRCHRLLATLVAEGYVYRVAGDRLYRAMNRHGDGPDLEDFSSVLEQAYDALRELRDASTETAHLAALAGRHIYLVAAVESPHLMRVASRVGMRMSANATAAGKVLLAQRPSCAVRELFGTEPLPGPTEHAITDLEVLLDQLAEVREAGYARNLSESEPGMASLAVPVHLGEQPPYLALSLSGPDSRINPRHSHGLSAVEHTHLALLQEAAAKVGR